MCQLNNVLICQLAALKNMLKGNWHISILNNY